MRDASQAVALRVLVGGQDRSVNNKYKEQGWR